MYNPEKVMDLTGTVAQVLPTSKNIASEQRMKE